MKVQTMLVPPGLKAAQSRQLEQYAKRAASMTPEELLTAADRHVDAAAAAWERNRLVNLRLARAIREVIAVLSLNWPQVPEHARPWLGAAVLYFCGAEDDEPDFASPIGFEDDAEVLNACLRLAGREDLIVSPEEYDEV